MDAIPKKRHWFQIHLSTAIVLMFVAGGLIFLNSRFIRKFDVHIGARVCIDIKCSCGWPKEIASFESQVDPTEEVWIEMKNNNLESWLPDSFNWNILGLLFNLMIGVLILSLAGSSCEWRIRRRARQMERPEQQPTSPP